MRKRIIFFLVLVCLFGMVGCGKKKVKENVDNSFQIMDTTEVCEEGSEEIYRDSEKVYYLPCMKSENIRIEFSNGESYSLLEALEKKKVTIEELKKKGLEIEESLVEEEKPLPEEEEPKKEDSKNSNENSSGTNEKPKPSGDTNSQKEDTFAASLDDTILLNSKEIEEYNASIIQKTDKAYDIQNITSLSQKQIKGYIDEYSLPKLPQYNGKSAITSTDTKKILDNRNMDAIEAKEKLQKGIIVTRANLKSFPTDFHFFDKKGATDFDNLQESELHINTPLLILHESKDHLWYFVMTPFYVGWVSKENVALAKEEDYQYFQKKDSFIVITEPSVKVANNILDMSVTLPYEGEKSGNYQVVIPTKQSDGYVGRKTVTISKKQTHIGYLPYTKKNVYTEAFKYEGVSYHWGGMNSGVDCSGYVANVYRTFGFQFPRNTSSQNSSVGKVISLSGKTSSEKLSVLKGKEPCLLYQKGHVMLYLGMVGDKDYIIHASGRTMKVTFEELTLDLSYLTNIDRQVIIV